MEVGAAPSAPQRCRTVLVPFPRDSGWMQARSSRPGHSPRRVRDVLPHPREPLCGPSVSYRTSRGPVPGAGPLPCCSPSSHCPAPAGCGRVSAPEPLWAPNLRTPLLELRRIGISSLLLSFGLKIVVFDFECLNPGRRWGQGRAPQSRGLPASIVAAFHPTPFTPVLCYKSCWRQFQMII